MFSAVFLIDSGRGAHVLSGPGGPRHRVLQGNGGSRAQRPTRRLVRAWTSPQGLEIQANEGEAVPLASRVRGMSQF